MKGLISRIKEFVVDNSREILFGVAAFFFAITIIMGIFAYSLIIMTNDIVDRVTKLQYDYDEMVKERNYWYGMADSAFQDLDRCLQEKEFNDESIREN